MNFRLLTYNIHKGFTMTNRKYVLQNMKESIRETHADLVCLQEVVGHHVRQATSQFEFLADEVWPHYSYGKNAEYTEGHHGNAILSKYEIKSWVNHDVSPNKFERRGLLHSVIAVPEQPLPLHVYSLHLGLFEKDRKKQIIQLANKIAADVAPDSPLIIAGDFNDWRENASDDLARILGMEEAFLELNGSHASTFPAMFPFLSLDRIYYKNIKCSSAKILRGAIWNQLSDHLPLQADFEF